MSWWYFCSLIKAKKWQNFLIVLKSHRLSIYFNHFIVLALNKRLSFLNLAFLSLFICSLIFFLVHAITERNKSVCHMVRSSLNCLLTNIWTPRTSNNFVLFFYYFFMAPPKMKQNKRELFFKLNCWHYQYEKTKQNNNKSNKDIKN